MGNALFIVWRESTEALLVVGILYAWLNKHPDVRRGMRYLWGGVATGVGLALVLAAVMLGIARLLSDQALEYFQLAMMVVASVLIVQMVFWMRQHGRTFKRELEHDMQKNARSANWWGTADRRRARGSAAKVPRRSCSFTASARRTRVSAAFSR
jgi:high-affinity iron transporter